MILTYTDLHNQKQLDEVFKRYSKAFPEHCEITPEVVKTAVEKWIPLADFIEDQVSQGAMALFRIRQEEAVKDWCDAHWVAMKNFKPDMGHALLRYRQAMIRAYEEMIEYDGKGEAL
jgi:hypothetical protein